jgi:hypothetical protein
LHPATQYPQFDNINVILVNIEWLTLIALVCHDCHNAAQWALEQLGMDWLELLSKLRKN